MSEELHIRQEKWRTRAYMGVAVVAGCALLWVALRVMGVLWQAVATVVVTAIIAFMLHGIVNYLEGRGLGRTAASAIAIVGLLVVLVALIAAFMPALIEQIGAFSAALPEYVAGARNVIQSYTIVAPGENTLVSNLVSQATAWVQEQAGTILQAAAGSIFEGVYSFGAGVLIFFIALICAFWILADLPTISRELMSLFNSEQQKNVLVITGAFSTAVYGWAKATLVCAIIVGIINGIAFWILGVPYFALLAFLCGILYFIPYIGTLISAVIVACVGLLASPVVAILALAINVIAHNIVANLISPKLMESSVNVHPAVILIAILIGGALGGMVGMLFSIPVAAAIQGVFVTFFEQRTGKQLATEDGALFQKPKVKFKPTLRRRSKDEKPDAGD